MSDAIVCGALLGAVDGVITEATEDWSDMLGWTPDELVGRHLRTLVHPDDWPRTLAALEQLHAGRQIPSGFTNRYRHRDGQWVTLSWTVTDCGGVARAVAFEVPGWLPPTPPTCDDLYVIRTVVPLGKTSPAATSQRGQHHDTGTGKMDTAARITELEAENDALLERVAALEARLNAINVASRLERLAD